MKPLNKLLAQLILAAAKAYEDSFDKAAADAATEEMDQREKEFHEQFGQSTLFYGFVDYSQFYRLSLIEACRQVTDGDPLAAIIYYLLRYTWNDAIDWARVNS